jgi:hypothetical protein
VIRSGEIVTWISTARSLGSTTRYLNAHNTIAVPGIGLAIVQPCSILDLQVFDPDRTCASRQTLAVSAQAGICWQVTNHHALPVWVGTVK